MTGKVTVTSGGPRASDPGPGAEAYLARCVACFPGLLAALKDAEEMLRLNMELDLDFESPVTKRIIDGHAGMRAIRAAIAKAEGK